MPRGSMPAEALASRLARGLMRTRSRDERPWCHRRLGVDGDDHRRRARRQSLRRANRRQAAPARRAPAGTSYRPRGSPLRAADPRAHRVDRHRLTFGDDLARERALVPRLDLHRRLVGLDLEQHVAFVDGVALGLPPEDQRALLASSGRASASGWDAPWRLSPRRAVSRTPRLRPRCAHARQERLLEVSWPAARSRPALRPSHGPSRSSKASTGSCEYVVDESGREHRLRDGHGASGLADRGEHRLHVERDEAPKVDHLSGSRAQRGALRAAAQASRTAGPYVTTSHR